MGIKGDVDALIRGRPRGRHELDSARVTAS